MIAVRDLSIRYGDVRAVDGVSLSIPEGQFVVVTGPSGCGKSTLARALAGLIPHALPADMSGQVVVAGLDTRHTPIAGLAQHVGMVFQNPATQLFHLTVEDEVAFGPRNLGLSGDEIAARVNWALRAVGLHAFRRRCPAELSGGEKQRVAIASALAMCPRVLVLDEPTASLDRSGVRSVIRTLATLHRAGVTIVLVEHRLRSALRAADRVLLMEGGRIVADRPAADVLSDPVEGERLGLMGKDNARRWAGFKQSHSLPADERPVLVEAEGLVAGYNGRDVLRGIDLTLREGEFVALVGANGAGKSTLALALAGLLKPRQGAVRYAGGRRPRPGLDVALLFQNPADQLFTDSVDEEVAFGPRNFGRYEAGAHEETLRALDLYALRGRLPSRLSVGQQQRTALAACLAVRPRLVILDEPTLGQDWAHLQDLMDRVTELNRQGVAVLLISHDWRLVRRTAERVLVLRDGRIAFDGTARPADHVSTQPVLAADSLLEEVTP